MIEVDGFFERLHETEAEAAGSALHLGRGQFGEVCGLKPDVDLSRESSRNLDVLNRSRNVALVRADPVADHARAQHVGDEFVALAVPDEQRRTRTAAAVDLEEVLLLVAGDLNFVFQHARGPQHADDVGLLGVAQADDDVGGVLSQVAVGAVDFELLPVAAGENFDLGADSGFVVGQSLEREPQPVILIAAFIAQQHRWPVILRDEQVSGAVVVVVAGDDGARIFQLNLVETNVGGDVLEAVRSEIAEEANFALAVFRFADGDEVDPAVVVVVEGGDAVGPEPSWFREVSLARRLAVVVAPERYACPVVHPS